MRGRLDRAGERLKAGWIVLCLRAARRQALCGVETRRLVSRGGQRRGRLEPFASEAHEPAGEGMRGRLDRAGERLKAGWIVLCLRAARRQALCGVETRRLVSRGGQRRGRLEPFASEAHEPAGEGMRGRLDRAGERLKAGWIVLCLRAARRQALCGVETRRLVSRGGQRRGRLEPFASEAHEPAGEGMRGRLDRAGERLKAGWIVLCLRAARRQALCGVETRRLVSRGGQRRGRLEPFASEAHEPAGEGMRGRLDRAGERLKAGWIVLCLRAARRQTVELWPVSVPSSGWIRLYL
uniref:Uncharacterized protein n=1 Tax=Oryzias latipes TaxID=8090 RepID=A0A286P9Q8_ORYLA|nr:hypothetical protein [Oryzias latipes]